MFARLKQLLSFWGSANFIVGSAFIFIILFFKNPLLLKTDAVHLMLAGGGILFLILLITLAVSAVIWTAAAACWRTSEAAAALRALGLAFMTVLFVVLTADLWVRDGAADAVYLVLGPAAVLALTVIFYRGRERFASRLRAFGRVAAGFLVVSAVLFPASKAVLALTMPPIPEPGGGPRGVVLIVVDRLGANYLTPFNPAAPVPTPNFERIASESVKYTRAHSSGTFTYATFPVLYSGVTPDNQSTMKPERNLIQFLQRRGVRARLIVSQNNAMPDMYGFTYRGLRGALLSQFSSIVPRLLGLDYHVFLFQDNLANSQSLRLRMLIKTLYGRLPFMTPTEVLSDEIERLRKRRRPFFVMSHFFPASFNRKLEGDILSVDLSEEEKRTVDEINRNHYSYGPHHQAFVDRAKRTYLDDVQKLDAGLGEFWDRFKAMGWDKDTAVILTADHGCSFENGKIWYNYSIDEATLRVPLIFHYQGRTGTVNMRLCDTTDVTATILDLFGIPDRPSPTAVPLTSREGKNVTVSSGLYEKGKHFFVFVGPEKYIFRTDLSSGPDGAKTIFYKAFRTYDDGRETEILRPDPDKIAFVEGHLNKVRFEKEAPR
jgi:hypothetical protein